ncbi:MAG: hypothetical protein SFW67_21500 [Myxococcaceae bacterium]|nr:hypothetical protein [Myxococcaceae bacterium]
MQQTGRKIPLGSAAPIVGSRMKKDDRQLDLPLSERPKLRVINGLGQKQHEALADRDAVARVLIEAGADLLLRRISSERAEAIERDVDEVLSLFDKVDRNPLLMPVLKKKLDALEQLVRETREKKSLRKRRTF